jgi:hypothetical protein
MSKEDNGLLGFLSDLVSNADLQNLMKDTNTMKTIVSQIGSYLINCDLFNQILDSNTNTIIDKYLQSYQENRSDKNVYNIRQFLKSGHCKEALDDPEVQQYLSKALESPKLKDKFQKLLSENIKHLH